MVREVVSLLHDSPDVNLPGFFRQHAVRILTHFDRKYLRSSSPPAKQQALRAIDRLARVLDVHLPPFVPKFMALYAAAVQQGEEGEVRRQGVRAWLGFVRLLGKVSPALMLLTERWVRARLTRVQLEAALQQALTVAMKHRLQQLAVV